MSYVQVHAANTHNTVVGCPVFSKDFGEISNFKRSVRGRGISQNNGRIREECVKRTIEISERIFREVADTSETIGCREDILLVNGYRRLASTTVVDEGH
jgi:hypothetical protein